MTSPKQSDRDYLYRKNAKGKTYVYFRHPVTQHLTRLPDVETSREFVAAYNVCLRALRAEEAAAEPETEKRKSAGGRNSVSAAIKLYRESVSFTKLRWQTKGMYETVLGDLDAQLGTAALASITGNSVKVLMQKVAKKASRKPWSRQGGTTTADLYRKVLSNIWRECEIYDQFAIDKLPNPILKTKKMTTSIPHKIWPERVIQKFDASAPPNLVLARMMLHYSGQRGSDAIRMRFRDYNGVGITVVAKKAKDSQKREKFFKCVLPLKLAIDAEIARRNPEPDDCILLTQRGWRWANSQTLSGAIRKHLIAIGEAKPGEKTYSMHGQRRNAARDIAHLGVGSSGVMAGLGHADRDMADHYAADAEQKHLNQIVADRWDAVLAGGQVNASDLLARLSGIAGGGGDGKAALEALLRKMLAELTGEPTQPAVEPGAKLRLVK